MNNRNFTDKIWLEEQYITKIKSVNIIAKECGCNQSTICRWLKQLNIPIRAQRETLRLGGRISGKNHPMYGRHHKPESIDKMRQNAPDYTGDKNPFFDKHHTTEMKLFLSNHTKKCWQNDEFRKKRMDWLFTDIAKQIGTNNLPKDKKGDKNPNWKGGTSSYRGYGWKWREIRKTVLKLWGYKCLKCGLSEEEHIKLYNQGLQIHHIASYRSVKVHDISNLIPLCAKHHSETMGHDEEKKITDELYRQWLPQS
jgi:hypothetical protein